MFVSSGVMDKTETRCVIKFLHLQGKSATQIHNEMLAVYKDFCPSYDTVKRWKNHFKAGYSSIKDEPRSGRPASIDANIVARVEDLVQLSDNRITVKEIMADIGLSHGTTVKILRERLHMSKVSTRWVRNIPRFDQDGEYDDVPEQEDEKSVSVVVTSEDMTVAEAEQKQIDDGPARLKITLKRPVKCSKESSETSAEIEAMKKKPAKDSERGKNFQAKKTKSTSLLSFDNENV